MKEIVVDEEFIQRMNKYRIPNKDLGLVGACAESVVVFADKMLGMPLYSWQVYILKDMQKTVFERKTKYMQAYYDEKMNFRMGVDVPIDLPEYALITSRQIGKSTLDAIFSLWLSVFNHAPSDREVSTTIGIASVSDKQAKDLLTKVKKLIIIGDSYMHRTYEDSNNKSIFGNKFFSNLLDPTKGNSADTITFKKYNKRVHNDYLLKDSIIGSTLESYPPTAKVLGGTYSVVIEDECGKTDKMTDEFHDEFMYPTGDAHHAVRLYNSTGWTCSGFFYRMIDPDDIFPEVEDLEKYMFTIDAIRLEDPTRYRKVMKKINQKNADGKVDAVQRGYYCRFPKGDSNWFDPEDVHSLFADYKMLEEYKEECDLGIDFGGQKKSQTILTVSKLDEETNKIMRLWHREYAVGKDDNLLDDIRDLKKHFNIQRIVTEDIPQADFMIRKMRDLGWEVEAMSPRADKVKKYSAFRAKLHKGNISSYEDENLRTEMLALETNKGSTQSIIQHAPGYSDDRIDSFILSCFFFVNEDNNFEFYRWG